MTQKVGLQLLLKNAGVESILDNIRATHQNGGALFASFAVGADEAFDWFASRNRLLEFGLLRLLLDRAEVKAALPELQIPALAPGDPPLQARRLGDLVTPEQLADLFSLDITANALQQQGVDEEYEWDCPNEDDVFKGESSFLFDGRLALALYSGGAYTRATGDGRVAKQNALAFCEELFQSRFGEVWYAAADSQWTPWFGGIALDWTAVLFDQRLRVLSLLAITDSD